MPGSGPPKKKTQSQLRWQRERNLCLSIFYCDPRGLGPDPRLREKPRLPRGHRADRRLPADSALPTSAGEGAGREERLGIKPCMPGPRAASPFSVSTALTHPVNTRCSGRVFSGQGGRDEGEPLAARAQPSPGPAPGPPSPTRFGRAWAGEGARETLSAWSRPSCRSGMSSAPAPGPAPACLTLWDEEDFQGRRCRLLSDCANICERGGLRRVRSVKVENGV